MPKETGTLSIKLQLKQTWRLIKPISEMKLDTEQNDEIGVAVQSWLWVWGEVMAWQLSRLERLNGIQWSWAQIPLRPTFYSYFKESFNGEYHMYHSFRYTHVITSSKLQLKQRWRLIKAIAEMKLDTEQTMKLE